MSTKENRAATGGRKRALDAVHNDASASQGSSSMRESAGLALAEPLHPSTGMPTKRASKRKRITKANEHAGEEDKAGENTTEKTKSSDPQITPSRADDARRDVDDNSSSTAAESQPVASYGSEASASVPAPSAKSKKIDPFDLTGREFVDLLISCAECDLDSLAQLKDLAKGTRGLDWIGALTKGAADEARNEHNRSNKEGGFELIERELFESWLHAYSELIGLADALLETTHPNSEKRVIGLGRIAYTIAWNLVEQYYLDVTSYVANDPRIVEGLPTVVSVNGEPDRDDLALWNAQQGGIAMLDDLDRALSQAVTRWRKESRGTPKVIEDKEDILEEVEEEIRELTGFGGQAAHGNEIFIRSKTAFRKWVNNEPIPKDSQKFFYGI